jgi:hypothetical protein
MTATSKRAAREERTGYRHRRDSRAAVHESQLAGAGSPRDELAEACRWLRGAVVRMAKRRGQRAAAALLVRDEARRIKDLAAAIERGEHDARAR